LFDDGTVDEWDVLLEARRVAELEGGDDAGGVVAVALADADAVGVGEQVLQLGVGEEDEGLDEGEALDAAGGLSFEEGFELLALAVGVEERFYRRSSGGRWACGRSTYRGRRGVRLLDGRLEWSYEMGIPEADHAGVWRQCWRSTWIVQSWI
jgi:hypothetical protein